MRRADRLFQIVQMLRGGRLLRAEDLAGRLEVSKRTIYRDIADLMASGVPIDGEAGVGYVMSKSYDMPPLMFTNQELAALVAGARFVEAWGGTSLARAATEALVKINAVLPDEKVDFAAGVEIHAINRNELDAETRARLDELQRALETKTRLEVLYRDKSETQTARVIRPLGLWFWGTVWTLVAWCELRDDFRMFRVDRMIEVKMGERFRVDADKSLVAFFQNECYRK